MREEIVNNLKQIENDLDTADLLRKHKKYSDSVFHSQQAAEKALKTLYLHKKREIPFTHNLVKIVRELGLSKAVLKAARELTPDYITTRYVDAANGVPADMYDKESADLHYGYAEEIVECVKKRLRK